MIHEDDCKCVNCVAKGKPIREIFLKEVTAKILSKMEVCDWLEGYGQISSLAEQTYIRKYGFLLARLQDNPLWDCTDAAHPAWWRGEKYSAYKAAELIAKILSGEDKCRGKMNEPLETMRRSVLDLKRERDKLQCELEVMNAAYKSCFNDNQTKEIEKQDEQKSRKKNEKNKD